MYKDGFYFFFVNNQTLNNKILHNIYVEEKEDGVEEN